MQKGRANLNKRLLLMVAGGLALLLAVAGVAYAATVFGVRQVREKEVVVVERPVQQGVTIDLGEVVTNLADSSGRRLVKARIVVEVVDEKAKTLVEENKDKARSAIIGILRSKTVGDLHGGDGHRTLEEEIRDRLNLIITDAKVRAVYATDLVVQ